MENIDSSIYSIDASAKVLLRTLTQKLAPSLDVPADKELNWNDVLNNYTIAAKQLDTLWMDMKPEFSMRIVAPKNVIKSEFTIPQLLSTMTAPEDVTCIIQPDKTFDALTDSEEAEIQKLIRTHNVTIASVVDEFGSAIDDFKGEITKENTKKRKLGN